LQVAAANSQTCFATNLWQQLALQQLALVRLPGLPSLSSLPSSCRPSRQHLHQRLRGTSTRMPPKKNHSQLFM
jgi:hypothetical protein